MNSIKIRHRLQVIDAIIIMAIITSLLITCSHYSKEKHCCDI